MSSKNISFDQIPSSIRKPGKYFEFNTKLAVRTLPQLYQKMLILAQRIKALIEPEIFQGGTLNDMTKGGTFTGSVVGKFRVKITTAAGTDKFKWSSDDGATWSAEISLAGGAQTLQNGVTVTFGATTGHALNDEWRFNAYPEPSVAEAVAKAVFSDAEAAAYFGHGSIAHLMVRAAIKANPYLDITVISLDDNVSGVAAAGTITITGPATSAGVLTVYIGNEKIEAGISDNDTASDIAVTLCNAIAAKPELPITATNTAGVITLTAKNDGLCGNDIGVGYELTGALGVAVVIVAMASGASNPDPQDALDVAFPEKYDIIITPWNNQTDLETLRDHLDLVAGPIEQRDGIAVYGMNGALADATTLSGLINSGMILCAYVRYTTATDRRSMPYEIAAAMASVIESEEDPARPLNTLQLKGISTPNIADRLSRTEQESLLYNGVTPLEVGPGEKVQIVRAISTYIKDPQGIADIALLDITTMRTLFYVRLACRERISLRFPREKLSSKTPPKVKSELLDVLKKLEDLEIVEEVEANKDGLIVERDEQDPNRLNAKIPTDVVNGLHVFAGRIDLLL